MSLNKIYVLSIFIFLCLVSCKEKIESDSDNEIHDSIVVMLKDSILIDTNDTKLIKHPIDEDIEIIARSNKNMAVSYDENSRLVCVIYNDSIYRLGNFSNTFALPPNINFEKIDENVGILIESNIIQMGLSNYHFYLFEFDTINKKIFNRCTISKVSTRNLDKDTFINPIYHEYKIRAKEFILKEYHPYKSDTVQYTVKTHSCKW
jgi:hypothetical protein